MKTLDEVISDLERGLFVQESALHYLKEYRDECNNIVNVHDDYIVLRNEMAEELNKRNPPLDWNELKQMEGKPVWLESKRYGARWYLLENISDDSLVCIGIYGERAPYYRDDDDWQAYRKEKG